jgi:hypothetical protein
MFILKKELYRLFGSEKHKYFTQQMLSKEFDVLEKTKFNFQDLLL